MPSKQDLTPLLDVQQNQLNLVFSDSNGIDAKALAVLGANVAALLFIDASPLHLSRWKILFVYAPFVVSLLLDIFAVWPRRYRTVIPETQNLDLYTALSPKRLQLQLLANMQAALFQNSTLNRQRLRACTLSLALTGLGFLALLFIL